MIRRKEKFVEKNKQDTKVTENSFTIAVKKASDGGENSGFEKEALTKKTFGLSQEEEAESLLKAKDELMRAKEARNETTSESEQFRRDEK
ncbi:MAG: hypothetical protein WD426_02090 [Anditalea sp.]